MACDTRVVWCVATSATKPEAEVLTSTLLLITDAEDIEMECDMIVRTGNGVVDWWQKLTNNAVLNKFESWAAQWLVVVRGWVQSWEWQGP